VTIVEQGGAPAPQAAPDLIKETTTQSFMKDVIEESKHQPVLIDFWAEWCGPCKRLGPTIDELATDYDGRVTIGKLNVDDNPSVAGRFSIRGIPTLLLFKGGQIVEQVVGLADKDSLKKLIDKHV
jgi:putative thioredoxin